MPRSTALPGDDVDARLRSLTGWSRKAGKLHREFRFDSFPTAFAFMTRVAFEAESMDHHPDWSNSYTTVVIDLSSHDVGGISERDFALATAISGVATAFGAGGA